MTDQERIEATERLHQLTYDLKRQNSLVESARERIDAPADSLVGSDRDYNRGILKEYIDEYRNLKSVYLSELRKLSTSEGLFNDDF